MHGMEKNGKLKMENTKVRLLIKLIKDMSIKNKLLTKSKPIISIGYFN